MITKRIKWSLDSLSNNLNGSERSKKQYMIFGTKEDTESYFDGKRVEKVNDYKYLVNIISET